MSIARSGALGAAAALLVGALAACGGGGDGVSAALVNVARPPPTALRQIGGTVSGLAPGQQVTLRLGAEELVVAANGGFSFAHAQADGTLYGVVVVASPPERRCAARNGSGRVSGSDVRSVVVDCSTPVNWVADGDVLASALSADGRVLYIGGEFTRVGPRSGHFVPVEAASGANLPFAPVNGRVRAQVPDGSGGWYLGGSFVAIGAVPIRYLAHVDADGRVDTGFLPAPDEPVSALALAGDTLFVGGDFARIGAANRSYVAALDARNGVATSWSLALDGQPRALAVGAGVLYLGGDFTTAAGQRRAFLAAADAATGALAPWDPQPSYLGGYALVQTIRLLGADVLVGGQFTNIGGQARANVAVLDGTTGAATPWDARLERAAGPGVVHAVEAAGDTIYVGGVFDSAGGLPRASLAALDATTGAVLPWNPPLGSADADAPIVTGIAASADTIYAGGQFRSVGVLAVANLAALDRASGAPRPWSAGATTPIVALAGAGDRIWVTGSSGLLGGTTRNHLAAIDAASGALTPWDPDAPATTASADSGVVAALVLDGARLVVAGSFERIGGADRAGLAALDAATGAILPWQPQVVGTVDALAVSDGVLFVGGRSITEIDGQPRRNLAAFDTAADLLLAWAPDAEGTRIRAIAASAGAVYIAGTFLALGGEARNGAAAFDRASGALLPWDARVDYFGNEATLFDLKLVGATLYLVGYFDSVGGTPQQGVGAVDAATAAPLARTLPIVPQARAFAIDGDTIYVATERGGGDPPAPGLVAASLSSGMPTTFAPVLEGTAFTLCVAPTAVYAGGNFTALNAQTSPQLAFVPR